MERSWARPHDFSYGIAQLYKNQFPPVPEANHHSRIIRQESPNQSIAAAKKKYPPMLPLGYTRTYALPATRCTRCRPIVADAAEGTPGAPTSPRKGNKKKVHTLLLPW
jgi:hypothetical protein